MFADIWIRWRRRQGLYNVTYLGNSNGKNRGDREAGGLKMYKQYLAITNEEKDQRTSNTRAPALSLL